MKKELFFPFLLYLEVKAEREMQNWTNGSVIEIL